MSNFIVQAGMFSFFLSSVGRRETTSGEWKMLLTCSSSRPLFTNLMVITFFGGVFFIITAGLKNFVSMMSRI